jgi:hypothetical protein
MKVCKGECGLNKKNSDYYKGKSVCKLCFSERERLRYHEKMKNPESKQKRIEQKKTYSQSDAGKAVQKNSDTKRDATNERKLQIRSNTLKRKYDIDINEWNAMYVTQGGKCGCCNKPLTQEKAHTDHNHKTGEVRGLLCNGCNTGLGHFGDSPSRLQQGINYLMRKGYYGEH